MTNKRESKRDTGLEWQVLGDASAPLPSGEPEPEERGRRPWLPWLLAVLGALVLAGLVSGTTLVWRARQQQERLRADLLAVVEAETQAQAFGLEEQVERLADPRAPEGWREMYAESFEAENGRVPGWLYPGILPAWRPPDVRPQVRNVVLEEEGQRAVAEVVWEDRSEVVEQRAYRWVRSSWRRTPLREEADRTAPWHESRTEHYLLRAQPDDYAIVGGEAQVLAELEGLREHLRTTWPEIVETALPPTMTLTLYPQEFRPVVTELGGNTITINTPDVALLDPESPLSMTSQRRLTIAITVAQLSLLPMERADELTGDEEGFLPYIYIFYLLPEAEAHLWVLDEAEQRALRNAWREELDGAWVNPLAPFESPGNGDNQAEIDEVLRWLLSARLFVAHLAEAGYLETPGDFLHVFLEQPSPSFEQTLHALTGLDSVALEALARDYALTME